MTLAMTLAAIAVWFSPSAAIFLQYDRYALAAGQWHRLLTCQWTHFSWSHFLWDTGAFALLGSICELRSRGKFVMCVVVSAVLIPAAIWIFQPHVEIFRGLSGIDSALFALLAIDMLRSQTRPGGRVGLAAGIGLLLALSLVKIAIEVVTGKTVFVDSAAAGMTPLPLAHLLGAIAGIFCAVIRFIWRADVLVRRLNPRRLRTAALQAHHFPRNALPPNESKIGHAHFG
jgi:rhomboid family GlyGly-CTERM serine protease